MSGSGSTDDIINDSFIKKEAPQVKMPSSSTPISNAHKKVLETFDNMKKEGAKLASVIIQDRQREAMASTAATNPYLIPGLVDPPAPILKKRGRPKKAATTDTSSLGSAPGSPSVSFSNPLIQPKTPPRPKTPERQDTSTPPPTSKPESKRIIRIKQIQELCKLYPRLRDEGIAPPPNFPLQQLSDDQLNQLYNDCKKNGACATGEFEYQFVSSTFYKILDLFEPIAYLVSIFTAPNPKERNPKPNPIYQVVAYLSRQPHGSFSKYVHKCIIAGDDIGKDLKEIAIDLMGYFPDSPYARLAIKLAYKVYDYSRFQMDSVLEGAMQRAQAASEQLTEEQMNFFQSLSARDYTQL